MKILSKWFHEWHYSGNIIRIQHFSLWFYDDTKKFLLYQKCVAIAKVWHYIKKYVAIAKLSCCIKCLSRDGNFVDKVNVSCYGFLSISQVCVVCVVLWWDQKVVAIRKFCRYIKSLALYEKNVAISRYNKSWLVYTTSGATLKDPRKYLSVCKCVVLPKV